MLLEKNSCLVKCCPGAVHCTVAIEFANNTFGFEPNAILALHLTRCNGIFKRLTNAVWFGNEDDLILYSILYCINPDPELLHEYQYSAAQA